MPLSPAPIQTPVVSTGGVMTPIWVRWLLELVAEVDGGGP